CSLRSRNSGRPSTATARTPCGPCAAKNSRPSLIPPMTPRVAAACALATAMSLVSMARRICADMSTCSVIDRGCFYRGGSLASVAGESLGDGLGLPLFGHGVGHHFAGEGAELEAVTGTGADDPQVFAALEDEALILRHRVEAAAYGFQPVGAEIGDHAAQMGHDLSGLVP